MFIFNQLKSAALVLGFGCLGLAVASATTPPISTSTNDPMPIYVQHQAQTTSLSIYPDGTKALHLTCGGNMMAAQQDQNSDKLIMHVMIVALKIARLYVSGTIDKHVLEPQAGKYSVVCESGKIVLRLGEGLKLVELK